MITLANDASVNKLCVFTRVAGFQYKKVYFMQQTVTVCVNLFNSGFYILTKMRILRVTRGENRMIKDRRGQFGIDDMTTSL